MKLKLFMQIFLLMSCSLALHAQKAIHRQRSGVPQQKHISFAGIEINGASDAFFKALKKKGYAIKIKEEYMQYYTYAVGSFAGMNGWEINVDFDEKDSIYSVMLYMSFLRVSEQLEAYSNVKSYIEKTYKYSQKDQYINDDAEIKSEDSESVYTIGDLGAISVGRGVDGYYSYVGVRFMDKSNSRLHGFNPQQKAFELSNVSNQYQKCYIQTSEFEGSFSVLSNDKVYRFIVRQDDARQINNLLNSKYDNTMKIYLLNSYILRQLDKCRKSEFIPIVLTDFNNMSQSYLAKIQEQKRKEAELKANPKLLLLEILRYTIFSREERKTLDKIIPPEIQRQMIGGCLQMVTAETLTQWDMLNNAQKAVIHNSHNGK